MAALLVEAATGAQTAVIFVLCLAGFFATLFTLTYVFVRLDEIKKLLEKK